MFWVYSNQDDNDKSYKVRRYLPKGVIKNHNVIINAKSFYDPPINSDTKWYEEIRKLKTGQGKDYTAGCLLDYYYIKNGYSIIIFRLSRQKESDADPKPIQQI